MNNIMQDKKRKIRIISFFVMALIVSIIFIISSENNKFNVRDNCDFRNAKLGDSKETVLRYENEIELFEYDDNTLFSNHITIDGYNDSYYCYIFNSKNQLEHVYMLLRCYGDMARFMITDYDQYKKSLSAKYGKPIKEEGGFTSISMSYYTKEEALRLGGYKKACCWETSRMKIELLLGCLTDSDKPSIGIIYSQKQ